MTTFPTGKKYGVIYADPPWFYRVWSAKGGHKSASVHYPVMKVDDIKRLPVVDLAAPDCALFLWVTMPNLLEGIEVMSAWGFKYKTCAFTWIKTYESGKPCFGLGYWTRANAELCLLGTRGKPKRVGKGVRQVVMERRREHSRKPDCVRDRIVELMGWHIPRIELFARQESPGWTSWGDEL